ncbi:MAG: type II secretion system protein [Capsulimonadaceae bacterium]
MLKTKGFTLAELLVIVAIMAILSAVLFPVFAQVRDKATEKSCLSNLSALGLGMSQYVQDNNGHMPNGWSGYGGGGGWATQLYPYIKNTKVYLCPADPVNSQLNQYAWTGAGANYVSPTSYCYNSQFVIPNALAPAIPVADATSYTLAAATSPANTVVLCEVANSTSYNIDLGPAGTSWGTCVPYNPLGQCGLDNTGYGYGGFEDPGGLMIGAEFGSNGSYACSVDGVFPLVQYATGIMFNASTNTNLSNTGPNGCFAPGRHNGGSNFLLADMHAKWFLPDRVGVGFPQSSDTSCGTPGDGVTTIPLAPGTECPEILATFNLK